MIPLEVSWKRLNVGALETVKSSRPDDTNRERSDGTYFMSFQGERRIEISNKHGCERVIVKM